MLVEALLMTASDLCSSAKSWQLQLETVAVIYNEFWKQGDLEKRCGRLPVPIMDRDQRLQQATHQGDVEKSLGWKPIPLFDRDHALEVASMQVGFLGGICQPCYDLLEQVLPNTKPLKEQCERNLNTWRDKAEERKKEIEDMLNAKSGEGEEGGGDDHSMENKESKDKNSADSN